ncbi:MAG TPA: phospholipase D-like domain-containing protein, partial [Geobacteraceae bacterium]
MSLIRHKKGEGFFRTRKFLGRFRRSTKAAATQGNGVDLYPNGGEFFPAFFAALRSAQRTICLEFYIVRDDPVGREMSDLLIAAAERGVSVSLLYDYIGSFETPSAFFRRLEQGGVDCRAFNAPPFRRGLAWFDKRDHRKMAVIDGIVAFAGGLNIGAEYAGYGESREQWRDVGIRVRGPAAVKLQKLFCENWEGETGRWPDGCYTDTIHAPRAGDAEVHIVSGGPHQNRSFIHNAFRLTMAGASHSI